MGFLHFFYKKQKRILFLLLLILSLLPSFLVAEGGASTSLFFENQKKAKEKPRDPFIYSLRQINTPHFQIVYEPQNLEAARETAGCCEEVYRKVTTLLDSYPPKITVYLHGRLDMANGSYHPAPESLHLYVTSPTDSFHGAKTENWIKGLLTHELTHYVHLSYEKGWIYELSKFFGPSIKALPGAFLPGFILEGYTTNTETLFTNGGRGRNPLFEIYYKSHIFEGNLFTLNQAKYNHTSPPTGRIYVAGYIFIRYLIDTYGENILKELHQSIVMGNPFDPDSAIFKVTGKTTQQLWDQMRQELIKKYHFTLAIEAGEPLSPHQEGDFYQALPSKKGWLLYSRNAENSAYLSFWNPKTNEKQRISKALLTDNRSFTIDQAGEKIIFSSYDVDLGGAREAEYNSDLFIIDFKSKGLKPYLKNQKWKNIFPKRLTYHQHLWHPALSGDGKRLVAVQKDGSYSRLVEIDLKTAQITPITEIPFATLYNPVLNDDGSKILFTANFRGKQDIWLYQDGNAVPLTKDYSESEYFPSFVTDEEILFSSDQDGTLKLYQMNLKSRKIKLALSDPIGVLSAQPYEGEWLYASYRSRGYSLFLSTATQRKSIGNSLTEKEKIPQTVKEQISADFSQKGNSSFPNQTESDEKEPFPLFRLPLAEQEKWGYPPPPELPILEDQFFPNLARLIAWTPLPFHYRERSSKQCGVSDPLGIGFALVAQSIDHTSFLQTIITNSFHNFQPSIFIDSRFKIGRFQFDFSHKQQYGLDAPKEEKNELDSYYQYLFDKLIITVPLYNHFLSKNLFGLTFQTGLAYELEIRNQEQFFLFQASSSGFEGFNVKQNLIQFNGINFYFSQMKAPAAIYPEAQFKSSLGVQVGVPLTQEQGTFVVGLWDTAFSVPLMPRHNLFASLQLGYTSDQKHTVKINPRGFTPQSNALLGKGVATLGYNYQFSKIDIPLHSNLSFHGVALALFLQTQFFYTFLEGNAVADPFIYSGIELKPILGWSQGTFPVTVGINLRWDPTLQHNFNRTRDIAWYFGFDSSFITSYQNKKASFIPQSDRKFWKLQE